MWNQGLLTKSNNCTTLVKTLRVSLLKASDHHILQQLVVITLLTVDVNYYVIICSKSIAKKLNKICFLSFTFWEATGRRLSYDIS
jgi:hypothetical protein